MANGQQGQQEQGLPFQQQVPTPQFDPRILQIGTQLIRQMPDQDLIGIAESRGPLATDAVLELLQRSQRRFGSMEGRLPPKRVPGVMPANNRAELMRILNFHQTGNLTVPTLPGLQGPDARLDSILGLGGRR